MIDIEITNTKTGEKISYRDDSEWEDHSTFVWSEGNWGCDCNRHTLFMDAKGIEEYEKMGCGDGYYRVRICLPDGRQVYEG